MPNGQRERKAFAISLRRTRGAREPDWLPVSNDSVRGSQLEQIALQVLASLIDLRGSVLAHN